MPEAHGFVGLQNYEYVIQSSAFWDYFVHDLVWTVGSVGGEYLVGITTALLLDQEFRGRAIFRGIIIIPWLVPIAVASVVWQWVLDPSYGILDYLLKMTGIISSPVDWLGSPSTAMFSVIFINVWRSFPFFTIMLLASLQAVPREEIEASLIDGAGAVRRFWNIKFPYLKTASSVLIVLNVMWVFNNFSFIWLLTRGGPLSITGTLAIHIYRYAFEDLNFGNASALAVIAIIFLLVIIGLVRFLIEWWKMAREGK